MYTGTSPPCRTRLAQLDRLAVDNVLCAGDLLDWGPSPDRCIELLRERQIPCVRGNHDFLDVGGETLFDPADIAFIDALPRTWERTITGVRLVVTHASPGDDQRGIHQGSAAQAGAILATAAADVLVVGHTHIPMNLRTPQGSIVNPGSMLQQPPGTVRIPASGTFGVLESVAPVRRASCERRGRNHLRPALTAPGSSREAGSGVRVPVAGVTRTTL
jgi:predicted phosphodiesterase